MPDFISARSVKPMLRNADAGRGLLDNVVDAAPNQALILRADDVHVAGRVADGVDDAAVAARRAADDIADSPHLSRGQKQGILDDLKKKVDDLRRRSNSGSDARIIVDDAADDISAAGRRLAADDLRIKLRNGWKLTDIADADLPDEVLKLRGIAQNPSHGGIDAFTHTKNVMRNLEDILSSPVGRQLSAEAQEQLRMAAMLHDVGKAADGKNPRPGSGEAQGGKPGRRQTSVTVGTGIL